MAKFNMDRAQKASACWQGLRDFAALKITKKQMWKLFDNDLDLFKQYKSDYDKAIIMRSNIIKDRNLEVVFIQGPSGSGKTTYAKYLADKLHYDAFVSGSGEDILDGYDKEECIILDDFRSNALRFSELLKFLDNNTNSSVKSRYYNKDISNCKVIFITSVFKPEEMYSLFSNDDGSTNDEPIEQLLRRLKHHYFIIEDDFVWEYNTQTLSKKKFASLEKVFNELGIDRNKVDDNSLMNAFDEFPEESNEEIIF